MSSSVLYERLGDLTAAGLVERTPLGGYGLTAMGKGLGRALEPLAGWADDWSASLE